jgi:hypothetical protein
VFKLEKEYFAVLVYQSSTDNSEVGKQIGSGNTLKEAEDISDNYAGNGSHYEIKHMILSHNYYMESK